MTPEELKENVDTIVILMFENRSFDHLLGHLSLPEYGGRADVDGIRSLDDPRLLNPFRNGMAAFPFISDDSEFTNDIAHERGFIKTQLAYAPALQRFGMNGFVQADQDFTGTSGRERPFPLGVLTPDRVPVSHFLAQQYAICDRWFAPLPTSTQPNRLMAMGGDTLRDTTRAGLLANQDLLYDWLDRHQVRWRAYPLGLPFLTLMPKMIPRLVDERIFRPFHRFEEDWHSEGAASRPQVIFIEPDYADAPVHPFEAPCDNHPPLPISLGEAFLRRVYQTLISNRERWSRTVFLVTYDEHGGFFDHVPPVHLPYAAPPGAEFQEGPFETTGVRVPAFVVSPMVGRATVSHALHDHTSMLQLMAERFGAPGERYSPSVQAREAAGVKSIADILQPGTAPGQGDPAPDAPVVTSPGVPRVSTAAPTEGQNAFLEAANRLLHSEGARAVARYPGLERAGQP